MFIPNRKYKTNCVDVTENVIIIVVNGNSDWDSADNGLYGLRPMSNTHWNGANFLY